MISVKNESENCTVAWTKYLSSFGFHNKANFVTIEAWKKKKVLKTTNFLF